MRKHSRMRLLLLAASASLMLSGTRAPEPEPVVAAPVVTEPTVLQDVARTLQASNRHLPEAQADRIAEAVVRYSRKYDLDPSLVTAVMLVESGARQGARSPKGALGLMQVMPHMLRPMGLAGNPSSVETNIEAGCMILADNIRRLGEEDGISAYFWGSQIRGVAYLNRVQAARERVRAELRS